MLTVTEHLCEINSVEFCNVKRCPFQPSQEMTSIAFSVKCSSETSGKRENDSYL